MDEGQRGGSPRDGGRVLILNPAAGGAEDSDRVRELAAGRGFDVRETSGAGDAIELAREAAPGTSLVAAAGGDGTANEVVYGLLRADAAERVGLGLVPMGTGNNFAGNVGITGIEHAFEVMEAGDVRTIDLGFADGRPFLNSCIGGITAEASAETTSEAKSRFGVLAYVLATLRTAVDYEGLRLHIETIDDAEEDWNGEAAFVLIGNGRRFPGQGGSQADMEDGRLDVTVIEDRPAIDLVEEAAISRLFGGEPRNVTRFRSVGLSVSVLGDDPATFSLDGEMTRARELEVRVRGGVLRIHVGESYEPHPDG